MLPHYEARLSLKCDGCVACEKCEDTFVTYNTSGHINYSIFTNPLLLYYFKHFAIAHSCMYMNDVYTLGEMR